MSPAISQAALAPALTPAIQPWKFVHLVFRELIRNTAAIIDDADWLVFIDTNPSFSIYTELAVAAADRLITPVNADDSSRVATNAMFILLHGQIPPHPIYGSWTFAAQAATHRISVPLIHIVVGNRLTQYGGSATAFSALSDATANTLYAAYQAHPNYFTTRLGRTPPSLKSFRHEYSVALRDFNTAGVVAAHLGRPLSKLAGGHYDVHGASVQINTARVKECESALDELLAFID